MLPDDGLNGPKHVEAIQRDILSVSCSILCFNKECICWQRSFERIKMHGKTTKKKNTGITLQAQTQVTKHYNPPCFYKTSQLVHGYAMIFSFYNFICSFSNCVPTTL
jgi:hypothetical protein